MSLQGWHVVDARDSRPLEVAFLCPRFLRARGGAETLAGATMRDGTRLSEDNWQGEFEEWRERQENRG